MRQTLITDYFYPVFITWRCTECGIDLGLMNPRQLCGKTYCIFKTY